MYAPVQSAPSTTSVTISSIRNGLSYVFDTSYSQRLVGMISSEEWSRSIQRINAASQTILGWITALIGAAAVITGFSLFISGAAHGGFDGPPPIIFVGMAFFMGGGIFIGVSRHLVAKMIIERITQAIQQENTYYSSRQCSWRLHAIPAVAVISRQSGYVRTIYDYVIEIECNQGYEPPAYSQAQAQAQPQAYVQSGIISYQQPQPQSQAHVQSGILLRHDQPQQSYQTMNQKCTQCQHSLIPTEKFCSQCGCRITAAI